MLRISRPLEYADRYGRQQADQAIKRNVVRALVELITNSDDSYNRLEGKGKFTNGEIIIEILRKHNNSEIKIIDFAEGMNEENMDEGVGGYGGETSEFSKGSKVRGYFGRGLKDAILGLGNGEVISIQNEKLYCSRLVIEGVKTNYKAEITKPVSELDRIKLGIERSNGTVVNIIVSRDEVRMPQVDTLRRQLSFYYSIRDILSNPKRKLILRELRTSGKVRSEVQLSYRMPKGLQLLSNSLKEFEYNTHTIRYRLIIYRSEVYLNTPGEEGPIAQGGFLIGGRNAIYDSTLFKFEGLEAARRFCGRVICENIDEILKNDDSILRATRDGLDWEHEFNRIFKREIETFLEPLVRQEEQRAREKESKARSAKLQKKLDDAIALLNRIAKQELEELKATKEPSLKPENIKEPVDPKVPESGFGFIPDFSQVISGKEGTLLLRALTKLIQIGSTVNISSDNPEIIILTPNVSLQERQGFTWLLEAKVRLEGGQVNNQGVVTAEADSLKAEALVEVIAYRPPPPPPHSQGLFNEIKFDRESQQPPQRVRFDRATGNIVIYSLAPSVKPYVTKASLEVEDSPQGQVLLAELILEASRSENIRLKNEHKVITLPRGTEVDALENEYRRYEQKYASMIHDVFVDPEYRH